MFATGHCFCRRGYQNSKRIICAWIKDWEEKDVGPTDFLEQEQCILCMLHKYGSLMWIDPYLMVNYTLFTLTRLYFKKSEVDIVFSCLEFWIGIMMKCQR